MSPPLLLPDSTPALALAFAKASDDSFPLPLNSADVIAFALADALNESFSDLSLLSDVADAFALADAVDELSIVSMLSMKSFSDSSF